MTALLEARALTKRFGNTLVLDSVSLNLAAGRVRALVGMNGAGKSTLLNILGGVVGHDAGALQIGGTPYAPRSTAEARAHGVLVVHQDPAIVADLSVEANVMLGCERSRSGLVRRRLHTELAAGALARLGYAGLDLRALGRDLSLPLRHVVAIARALVLEARVVVLDEPTSALAPAEAARVLAVVRELAAQGVAVLYVTHFLPEVRAATDDWTVLRDGRVVAEGASADVTVEALVEHMSAGRQIGAPPRVPRPLGDTVLTVTGLSGVVAPEEITLTVRRGEIFGLFGLAGAGRSSLLRTIIGSDRRTRGAVRVNGSPPLADGALRGVRAGIGLLPEERQLDGLLPRVSVVDNVTLARLAPFKRGGFLRARRLETAARTALADVAAVHVDVRRVIDELSGGTQQRIALARLIHQAPEVFLLDEPARGIDVSARGEVYCRLGELAASGRSIVLSSSSVDDMLAVCDTLAVMRVGRIVAIKPAAQWTREDVLTAAATGAENAA